MKWKKYLTGKNGDEKMKQRKICKHETCKNDAPKTGDYCGKHKPKSKPKPKEEEPRKAKPGKNDKVECADCGKTMSANTLRYKHVCKPPKSEEIQKEKPRKRAEKKPSPQREPQYSPSTPRTKMVQYYREARIAQQEQKRARFRSWLGND